MITRRTKTQLLVFVIITLVGVSYVGAKYAKLDRYFVDRTYEVTAEFTDSGGAFAGGQVTYRGVSVVSEPTRSGRLSAWRSRRGRSQAFWTASSTRRTRAW